LKPGKRGDMKKIYRCCSVLAASLRRSVSSFLLFLGSTAAKVFRADQPRRFAHDVQLDCGMGARGQHKAAGLRVQLQQVPRCCQRNNIRPGLIYLFNKVQSMALDRVKTGRLEFHAPKKLKGIARLRRNPGMDFRGGIPDLVQVAIHVPDVPNHHAARAVFHNHAPFLSG
jgi:hypothetical protein